MTCGECANVTAPGKGFPNHVYCLRFLLHMEKREDASRCRYFIPKPQTNADRIRSMTDEGIEDWYWWMHKEMMRYTDSRIFVHDWLKAPVEVDK